MRMTRHLRIEVRRRLRHYCVCVCGVCAVARIRDFNEIVSFVVREEGWSSLLYYATCPYSFKCSIMCINLKICNFYVLRFNQVYTLTDESNILYVSQGVPRTQPEDEGQGGRGVCAWSNSWKKR